MPLSDKLVLRHSNDPTIIDAFSAVRSATAQQLKQRRIAEQQARAAANYSDKRDNPHHAWFHSHRNGAGRSFMLSAAPKAPEPQVLAPVGFVPHGPREPMSMIRARLIHEFRSEEMADAVLARRQQSAQMALKP